MRGQRPSDAALSRIGSEVVVLHDGDLWKIHLHAPDVEVARRPWRAGRDRPLLVGRPARADVHPAGPDQATMSTLSPMVPPRFLVARLKRWITLLDSHINFGDLSLPEPASPR